jgi:hypothetical protein
MISQRSLARPIAIAAIVLAAACSSSGRIDDAAHPLDASPPSPEADARAGSSTAGDGGATADASCPTADAPDASSPLIITVRNAGTAPFALKFACSGPIPVSLVENGPRRALTPSGVDPCGFDCSPALSGTTDVSRGCSDCGPDVFQTVAPGATTTISWNRRLYREVMLPIECTRLDSPYSCALGEDAGSAPLQATLSVCYDDPATSCAKVSTIPFTLDPTLPSIELEVG